MNDPNRQVSILLVEDEALIRMMVAQMVEELGHTVVAEAANIKDALELAQTAEYDIAILDINVGGERIDPVADVIAVAICHSCLLAVTVLQVSPKNYAMDGCYKSRSS